MWLNISYLHKFYMFVNIYASAKKMTDALMIPYRSTLFSWCHETMPGQQVKTKK
jgi:hypothetical protein